MLGKALRLIRVFHDMSLTDLADELGMSKSYLSEIERGHKKVTMETLEKYSAFFNVPMSSLLLFAEKSQKPNLPESARVVVADKVIKMLDWLATISEERA